MRLNGIVLDDKLPASLLAGDGCVGAGNDTGDESDGIFDVVDFVVGDDGGGEFTCVAGDAVLSCMIDDGCRSGVDLSTSDVVVGEVDFGIIFDFDGGTAVEELIVSRPCEGVGRDNPYSVDIQIAHNSIIGFGIDADGAGCSSFTCLNGILIDIVEGSKVSVKSGDTEHFVVEEVSGIGRTDRKFSESETADGEGA